MEPTYLGADENTESALAYVLWFVTGIFFLVMEEWNGTVRFHAIQSILLSLLLVVVIFVLSFIPAAVPFIPVIWIIEILLWFVLIVTAYQGRKIPLPLIGTLAESYA